MGERVSDEQIAEWRQSVERIYRADFNDWDHGVPGDEAEKLRAALDELEAERHRARIAESTLEQVLPIIDPTELPPTPVPATAEDVPAACGDCEQPYSADTPISNGGRDVVLCRSCAEQAELLNRLSETQFDHEVTQTNPWEGEIRCRTCGLIDPRDAEGHLRRILGWRGILLVSAEPGDVDE